MEKFDLYFKKHYRSLYVGLACIFFLLYLALAYSDYIWADESYTLAIIKHSFSEIWEITAADVHPPLYYFYLKMLISPFKYNLFGAKVASVLPYMFIIIWGGQQLKELANERTSLFFMILFGGYPFTLYYSDEIRMYSLAAAFVFASSIFAYKLWLNDKILKNGISFVLSSVLAAYTHYFAFVSIAIIYAILLILFLRKGAFKKWGYLVIFSLLLYTPWLAYFIRQLQYKIYNEYWIEKITLSTIGYYFYSILGSQYFYCYLLAFILCSVLVIIHKDKTSTLLGLCCILIPLLTMSLGIIASIIIRPVFVIRYLVPSAPLLMIFFAIELGMSKQKFIIATVFTLLLFADVKLYCEYYTYKTTSHNIILNERYDENAYVIIASPQMAATLCYYVEDTPVYCNMDISKDACPYPNMYELEELDMTTSSRIVMLWDGATELPNEYSMIYELYDVTDIGIWISEVPVKAYLFTHK